MNPWLKRLFWIASIGGGFCGLAITSAEIFQSGRPLFIDLLYVGVAAAYGFGIYGGIKLIEDEERGLSLLSWYFLAQTVTLTSLVLAYAFWSGCAAFVTVGTKGLGWQAVYGARWFINVLELGDSTLIFGVNLFGLWAVWYLRRELRRVRGRASARPEAPPTIVPPALDSHLP